MRKKCKICTKLDPKGIKTEEKILFREMPWVKGG